MAQVLWRIQVEKAQVVGYSWGRPLPEEGGLVVVG